MKLFFFEFFVMLGVSVSCFANSQNTEDFIQAACKADLGKMAVLYSTTADVDVDAISSFVNRRTALTCAVENSKADVVDRLAKFNGLQRVDFNKADGQGDTWLSLAVRNGSWTFAKIVTSASPLTNFESIFKKGAPFCSAIA